ncbi:MAG: metallophosphoesterase family protein [Treponema sp.]
MIITHEHALITNPAAYAQLQTADTASIVLLSDTHGNSDAVAWIFSEIVPHIDACLFAGDGAEDIITAVHTLNKDTPNQKLPLTVIIARGNCDYAYCMLSSGEGEKARRFDIPLYQRITIAQQHILLTHGHLCHIDFDKQVLHRTAYESGCAIAVHGHTHMQSLHYEKHTISINPGSPAHPRGGSPAGFAVLALHAAQKTGAVTFYTLHQDKQSRFSAYISAQHTLPQGIVH